MRLEFHQLERCGEQLRVRRPERQRRLLASLATAGQQTPIIVVADADFVAPVLRDLLLPHRHGLIRVGDQFILHLFQKTLHSAFFDGIECNAIDPRCAIVAFGHLVRFVQGFHLADVDV